MDWGDGGTGELNQTLQELMNPPPLVRLNWYKGG